MAIVQECPVCHRKQANKNKRCRECNGDLDNYKKQGKVKYYIQNRFQGKKRMELVGTSLEDAKAAEGKRKVQKRENPFFEVKPEAKLTFLELTEWYLSLEKVKSLAYYPIMQVYLKKFNSEFGGMIVGKIKPADLENLQAKRKQQGLADSTIDQEIGAAKAMINKAFDNDLVGGETVKAFKRIKKLLKRNVNARDKVLTPDQFATLMAVAPTHTRLVLATAFYTGMRLGEILPLTWDKVDMQDRIISLAAEDTKDEEPRVIPICDGLYSILKSIPRAIHDKHVFLYKGKPIEDIRTGLVKACRAAGIEYGRFVKGGFVFHDLRHTFNTLMRKANVPESVIMVATGHSTREMFDRYNSVDREDLRDAIKRYEDFVKGSVPEGDRMEES